MKISRTIAAVLFAASLAVVSSPAYADPSDPRDCVDISSRDLTDVLAHEDPRDYIDVSSRDLLDCVL